MEAMACGLPVVCSEIRGNVDLINDDGGALFDPYCAEDCADAMMRVLNADMHRLGMINQKRVVNYSVESIVSMMKSIYEG